MSNENANHPAPQVNKAQEERKEVQHIKTAEEVLKSDDDYIESISEIEKALIIERMELYANQFRDAGKPERTFTLKEALEVFKAGCDFMQTQILDSSCVMPNKEQYFLTRFNIKL